MRSITVASAGAPSVPTIGTATAGNGGATVAFTPSTYTGKGTVSYEVTSSPGGLNGNGSTSPISISLINGTTYTFTVKAVTNYGVSSASSASSNAVTPSVPLPPPPPAPPPCSCGWNGANCTGNGSNCGCSYVSYSCVGDLSYEYYDCGCAQTCPGTGGYNGAYRDGVCGYVTVVSQVCRCSAGSCVDNGCGGQICYDSCGQWCSGTECPAACPDCPGVGPCCPPAGCGGFKDGYICI